MTGPPRTGRAHPPTVAVQASHSRRGRTRGTRRASPRRAACGRRRQKNPAARSGRQSTRPVRRVRQPPGLVADAPGLAARVYQRAVQGVAWVVCWRCAKVDVDQRSEGGARSREQSIGVPSGLGEHHRWPPGNDPPVRAPNWGCGAWVRNDRDAIPVWRSERGRDLRCRGRRDRRARIAADCGAATSTTRSRGSPRAQRDKTRRTASADRRPNARERASRRVSGCSTSTVRLCARAGVPPP